ncbi:MAG: hypothetical protein ALECFALPRED_003600 [Alectoria fallacina]|uniref:BTB domain-containing protein n=1 Tax=Alectoria fallacina TaxID=1903189 RepID=A0A8H3ITE3_9LECA|nr:MAG: hypothetical protein ALECFALPRED_003600 [Alectoria fallacina]
MSKVHQTDILLLLSSKLPLRHPQMADTSITPTQSANVDADAAGDLVLVIGSGDIQRSVRASSKILSLASPVLAAMFSPRRFSEGTALSPSNPPEIHLPEDDPEAVTTFCHLVHFREYHGKQPGPSFDQLMNMALFCDKYDAGLAFNPWSELWLQPQSDSDTSEDYGNLLALAYAFDNQEGFWISSRSMMQYDMAERSDGTRNELLSLLPQGLYGKPDIDPSVGQTQTCSVLIVLLFAKRQSAKIASLLYLNFLQGLNTLWLVSFRTVLEVQPSTPILSKAAMSSKNYIGSTFGQYRLVSIQSTWTISRDQSPVSMSRRVPTSNGS